MISITGTDWIIYITDTDNNHIVDDCVKLNPPTHSLTTSADSHDQLSTSMIYLQEGITFKYRNTSYRCYQNAQSTSNQLINVIALVQITTNQD